MRYVLPALLAILWFLVVALWPRGSNLPNIEVPPDTQQLPEENLYQSSLTKAHSGLLGANFYESTQGKKHWNIRSKFAELHRKEDYAFMKEVTAHFFAETTSNIVSTQSTYGRSWLNRNLVQLEGNISIRSKKGYLFAMEKLDYHGKNHEFRTEDMVRMKGPDEANPEMYLQGLGMIGDIDHEHFRLRRRVMARKKLHSAEWLLVNSQTGEFFTNEEKALFHGSVEAEMPKVTITSRDFEIGTADGREYLSARGKVEIESRNRIGTAERAFIEVGGNQIILEGNAKIDAKGDHVQGRRIVLSTEDDQIEVEQARGRARQ